MGPPPPAPCLGQRFETYYVTGIYYILTGYMWQILLTRWLLLVLYRRPASVHPWKYFSLKIAPLTDVLKEPWHSESFFSALYSNI